MHGTMARWLWLAVAVVVLDQATKGLAEAFLEPYHPVLLTPWFNLTLVYNPGAAFSFLAKAGGWQRWLLAALAACLSGGLVVWLLRLEAGERMQAAALALVLGGAVGNLLDRLMTGQVIDFLDFHVATWHWPAFNLADSAITGGIGLLLALSFRNEERAAPEETDNRS